MRSGPPAGLSCFFVFLCKVNEGGPVPCVLTPPPYLVVTIVCFHVCPFFRAKTGNLSEQSEFEIHPGPVSPS